MVLHIIMRKYGEGRNIETGAAVAIAELWLLKDI
jgi:hypothetical protein